MRGRSCVFCLGLLALTGSVKPLPGCGDKFLVASRGTRFQRAPVSHESASILIYTSPGSETAKAFSGEKVDEVLRKAGHRPTIVTSAGDFQSALTRGGWDLVVVGIGDARAISATRSFGVLPVVFNPTADEWKQTRKQFPVVLHGPVKGSAVLEAVDQALAARSKLPAKTAKAAI